eukprot:TRINITY_DN7728_c0_g1_i1.p2 TRINITY_DN7728_c0_g1~~TRINITY_DN7728_c0_g1_i1.p2  ORF type:complete len:109 (+),score=27.25 TRINITY_DN7728_c0_g1_i1:46-327(+)
MFRPTSITCGGLKFNKWIGPKWTQTRLKNSKKRRAQTETTSHFLWPTLITKRNAAFMKREETRKLRKDYIPAITAEEYMEKKREEMLKAQATE